MARTFTRRRILLATAALAGGGLALTWLRRPVERLADRPDVLEPNAFLQVRPDGQVIFQLDKVEMGQGTMTGLVTLIAEELDLDPARFTVQFAPVMGSFQRPIQLTGQSRSLADSWEVLRETGATARAMLLAAAAEQWQVPADALSTDDGLVYSADGQQQLRYADLAAAAARQQPPWRVTLKQPADYRWIGHAVPRLDARDKVTGAAIYGMDVQQPGMLTAVVARCPEIGGRLRDFDATAARAVQGVQDVVALPQGVAVVADGFWAAQQGARQLQLDAQPGPLSELSDADLRAAALTVFERSSPDYSSIDGDAYAALRESAETIEAEYRTPYLAHATMEPMNATAHVTPAGCELWLPTQAPDIARNLAAEILGIERDQVQVHTTYLGGGFGRRVLWDYVAEAVMVAREFSVPVKLVWTREDDMRHGYFRQQSVHRLRGAADSQGAIAGWEHYQAVTPTADLLTAPTVSTLLPEWIPAARRQRFGAWLGRKTVQFMAAFQAREGAEHLIYPVANRSLIQYAWNPGVPVSIWRSVGNSYNAFAVESFVDELATISGIEVAGFRRALLQDRPRHLHVLERLLELSDWSRREPERGKGIAIFESFGTVVGQVAEVSVDRNSETHPVRVHRVFCVVDCGRAVNPDIVRAQMESGIIFGLTAALYGEINIDYGRVRQSNFHDYRMIRMNDAPAIDVEVVASEAEPTGVGEPGTPPIAPAVANAVFALTGERVRGLPLRFG